ncbi:MAG: fluoride efflux transporter CrcB [Burkholderiales bacterium]|jgi:CrcB protein|nr:fluoride efflux transporter CrcB [Burkholderiales bacterium]
MTATGAIAVAIGAVLGAWLRWALSLWLNGVHPAVPLGTWVANVVGGFVIGLAVAFFQARTDLPPEARLALVTGFLGALTTFSTFSAESVGLIERGAPGWALVHAAVHLGGSLAATAAGLALMRRVLG